MGNNGDDEQVDPEPKDLTDHRQNRELNSVCIRKLQKLRVEEYEEDGETKKILDLDSANT